MGVETTKMSQKSVTSKIKPLLLAIAGGAAGYFLMSWIMPMTGSDDLNEPLSKSEKLLLLPGILLSLFLVIAVHELGHLITGLIQGFKFQLYIVGPLGIKRDPETDRIVWYLNKELNLAGGLAATSPVDGDSSNIPKFARLVIAGPLSSLLLGLVLILIGRNTSGVWASLASISGALSLLIFLVTIIPLGSSTFMSDGKRFLRLLNAKTREVELAMMRISAVYTQTRRYEGLDMADVELMKTDTSPMMQTMAQYYAYLHYQSTGQMEKAEAERIIYLEKVAALPKGMQSFLDKEEERVKRLLDQERRSS